MKRAMLSILSVLLGVIAAGGEAGPPKPPYADDPALVAKIEALPDRTWMKLDAAARLQGKALEKWSKEVNYGSGPVGRDFCVKMAYAPDRQTAFYCGGNHGVPHKLSDAWEYHLGSNTWTLLAPPAIGVTSRVFDLYGIARKGQEDAAREIVKKHIVLEDGYLAARENGGPINCMHTWDGLAYDPLAKRALWAAPATGIMHLPRLYAEANNLKLEDVKAKLAPGIPTFWMFDLARNRWVQHTGPGPYPRVGMTVTMTFIPDLGKTLFYGMYDKQTWTYDAVANKWEKIATSKDGPGIEMMSAYSPKHKKLVTVQAKTTWTFDLATKTWTQVCTDDKNYAVDYSGFFGYDAGNDVFLLFQPKMRDKVRVYSLEKNAWTTAEMKGDAAPDGNRLQGYYDPDRNVLVACQFRSVWLYRYARHKAKGGG
jgi:hypothetical protein